VKKEHQFWNNFWTHIYNLLDCEDDDYGYRKIDK